MSFDGRFVIKKMRYSTDYRGWQAQAIRPERLTYDDQGRPVFGSNYKSHVDDTDGDNDYGNDPSGHGNDRIGDAAVRGDGVVSKGLIVPLWNAENSLALCYEHGDHGPSSTLYRLDVNGSAVYESWAFDHRSGGNMEHRHYRQMRRRRIRVVIQDPFTKNSEIAEFDPGNELQEYLTTTNGERIRGIEPTMTIDGKLMIFQGDPFAPGQIDYMMYTYNPRPCALDGWSPPQPVHRMATDSAVQKYPMAWHVMKSADGTNFSDANPLRAAYPWVDPEGRFVVFAAVRGQPGNKGSRSAGTSLIGHETHGMAYNIDGGINSDRYGYARAFFSSPMWHFEKERHPMLITQNTTTNQKFYLPVTKNHDILPLFGSNSGDYNEVNLDISSDPFAILNLPMNEMVTIQGIYDDRQTPDLSGHFATGILLGDAYTTTDLKLAKSPSGLLIETHSKGRVLVMNGRGGLVAQLPASVTDQQPWKGFTLQMNVMPLPQINEGCKFAGVRSLLFIANVLRLTYGPTHNVMELNMKIRGRWIALGKVSLSLNKWTHVAYTWDGETGTIREYLDGKRTMRQLPLTPIGRSFDVEAGTVYVGTDDMAGPTVCQSFVGMIDEVRLFSHVRSGRTICLSTYGTNCLSNAIQDTPTAGHFILAQQQPECNDPNTINSMECRKAVHRVCSQEGTVHALNSARNVWNTILQIIGSRPPVSLGGVISQLVADTIYDDDDDDIDIKNLTSIVLFSSSSIAISPEATATITCAPMPQEAVSITFAELESFHRGCNNEKMAPMIPCLSASFRFCKSIGWTTGYIFEVTTRAWVLCFEAGFVGDFEDALLSGCKPKQWEDVTCGLAVNSWCQEKGYDAGLIQELQNNSVPWVHCFHGSMVQDYSFT